MPNIIADNNQFFSAKSPPPDLKVHALNNGIIIMVSQGIKFLLQAASTIILARMLAPKDYGAFAMAMVVVGFLTMFKDMGLSIATIQRTKISHAQVSTLFWINLCFGCFLALITLVLAPGVARFYDEPKLAAILMVLGSTFVFNGAVIQHQALLKKHLRFVTLAGIEIGALSIGITTAVILASQGAGYWALACNLVVQSVVSMGLTFYFCSWTPSRLQKHTGVREMLKFGGYLTGFNLVSYVSGNTDSILIGKYIGAEATGIYTTAYTLFMLPISKFRAPLDQIAMPVLSALKDQPERYSRYYQRLLNLLATIISPIYIYCLLEADFIVRLTLGPNWLGVIPIFKILAVAGLVQGVASTRGVVLLSSGLFGRHFYWGLISACSYIVAFLCGLQFGVKGIAAAYTIAAYTLFFPSLFYSFYNTHIRVSVFMTTLIAPLAISLSAAAVLVALKRFWPGNSNIAHFCYLGAFVLVAGGLSSCRTSVRDTLQTMLKSMRLFLGSKAAEVRI